MLSSVQREREMRKQEEELKKQQEKVYILLMLLNFVLSGAEFVVHELSDEKCEWQRNVKKNISARMLTALH